MILEIEENRIKQKKMDYQNGKIYRLIDNSTGKQYIGSTTQSLAKRLYVHKCDYKRRDKRKIYCASNQIIANENYDIILIENYPCSSKEELLSRERHFIETLKCINKKIPIRTREEVKEYYEQYRQRNRHVLNETARTPLECECGTMTTYATLSRHRKTNKHHKEMKSKGT